MISGRAKLVMAGIAMSMSASATATSTEADLIAVHRAWAEARLRADTAFLERFYADELRIQSMDGGVVSRAQDITAFRDRHIVPNLIEDVEMRGLDYGKVAVVTGIEHVRGTAYGQSGEFYLRFTNVLVRRDGRWQLVLHQSTDTKKQ